MNITTLFSEINWLAVIVVIILSFVLGALWHSKLLFGKAWAEDSKTKYNSDYHGNPLIVFGLSALLHTVAVIGLAMFIGSDSNALAGMLKGLVVSIAWVSTSIGVTYIFVGRSFRLFLIDVGFYVVFLSLAGLILGVW